MSDEFHNTLQCDHCGRIAYLPSIEVTEDLPAEEMGTLVMDAFFTIKWAFGSHGWYTSVGLDLCPACCKAEGRSPGYVETNMLPDVVVMPRKQEEE